MLVRMVSRKRLSNPEALSDDTAPNPLRLLQGEM
jgi:hypothetical protein